MINEKGIYRTFAYGLLILRVGLGIMFMIHGYPKLSGGPDKWQAIGGNMSKFGLAFMPLAFGLAAALTEFLGGVFLALGLFFRPMLVLLVFVMLVATMHHIHAGDAFGTLSHPVEDGIVFIGLLFTGPGPISLDARMKKGRA